jgi:hypothetical protein
LTRPAASSAEKRDTETSRAAGRAVANNDGAFKGAYPVPLPYNGSGIVLPPYRTADSTPCNALLAGGRKLSVAARPFRSGSLSGLKTAVHFPVERDLTTPRILRLTNPVTSPAASRRVVADGETLNQPTNKGE